MTINGRDWFVARMKEIIEVIGKDKFRRLTQDSFQMLIESDDWRDKIKDAEYDDNDLMT